jgi:Fe-S-cluster-containing dehydrogenase component
VQVCPFGLIHLASGRKAVLKCDLCTARLAKGMEPACVASCPVRALAFKEVKADADRRRSQLALSLVTDNSR